MKVESNLLQKIRERPGIYIGGPSISALFHWICGYQFALYSQGIKKDVILGLPDDFEAWIAYRLHYYETTRGWRGMILSSCQGDECAAFDRFFELLDEHANRKGKLVEKLTGLNRTYSQTIAGQQTTVKRYPKRVPLVSYTDDPGFFAYSDEPGYSIPFLDKGGFCPCLTAFEQSVGTNRCKLTVLDPEIYQRWRGEDH